MDALDRNLVMRAERFTMDGDDSLSVTVEPSDRSVRVLQARLLDISTGGAKLSVATDVDVNDRISLRIVSPRLASPLDVDAAVCWCETPNAEERLLGIAFRPPLPDSVLHELVTSNSAAPTTDSRRDGEREPITVPARGNWEMSRDQFEGLITDMCDGGFCMVTNRGSVPGARVMLLFDYDGKSARVTARTQWQVESRGRFVSGCQFITPNGYSILRKVSTVTTVTENRSVLDRLFRRN